MTGVLSVGLLGIQALSLQSPLLGSFAAPNTWRPGNLKVWKSTEKLGSCASPGSFQPFNGLQFRLEFDPYGWNPHFNKFKLCEFVADFGSVEFAWKVSEEQGVWNDGQFTKWIDMTASANLSK